MEIHNLILWLDFKKSVMKKLFFTLFLLMSFSALSKAKSSDNPSTSENTNNEITKYSKIITVHGMVCAFCANSLEKKFKKEEAVDQIKVDLENKKISVLFKKGKLIKDEKLKEIISSSGFKVIEIQSG